MNYRSYPGQGGGFLDSIPPAVRQLILINGIIFLLQLLVSWVDPIFALQPRKAIGDLMVWQIFTYMFLHGGWLHIIFNMIGLYFLGSVVEQWWGTRTFIRFYLICGLGAGIVQTVAMYIQSNGYGVVVGASGAIFGVFVAFALGAPNSRLIIFPIPVPIRARTLLIGAAVVQLLLALGSGGGGVAWWAHLGGMLTGYLYVTQGGVFRKWRGAVAQTRSRARSTPPRESAEDARRREEIDRILDKISREGMGALTEEERRILTESAERARRRQGH